MSAWINPEPWSSWKRQLDLTLPLFLFSNFGTVTFSQTPGKISSRFFIIPLSLPNAGVYRANETDYSTFVFPPLTWGSFWLKKMRQEAQQSFLRFLICYQAPVTFPRDFNNQSCLARSSFFPSWSIPSRQEHGKKKEIRTGQGHQHMARWAGHGAVHIHSALKQLTSLRWS